MFSVAVIGAGASGSLVAAHFSRYAAEGARLVLVGVSARPARGLAYETSDRVHLLNVPAGNMSAFPDDREHFCRWAGIDAGAFAPRSLYGDYLASVWADTLQSGFVTATQGVATRLSRGSDHWEVAMADGAVFRARAVVLAVGNVLEPRDPFDTSCIAPLYQRNPWSADHARGLSAQDPVLLVGTGLTMVDVVLSLRENGHRGIIHAVSRHGRLSQSHRPYTARPLTHFPAAFASPVTALRWIRAESHVADDWRSIVDSLRPHTAAIWRSWTLAQRASFLRHARSMWDIHRHRMAPENAARLDEWIGSGTLRLYAGRVQSAELLDDTQVRLTLRHRGCDRSQTLDVARIINCTGPDRNFSETKDPLLAQLRQSGWMTPDALHLGIETDEEGRVLRDGGQPAADLYAIGPLRIPSLWESIAMPEIRVQAVDLARRLAKGAAV
ncbi:MAG TPA: FAD/NAD(P)-binding protein [Anaerolineales bacterium]|nr:FAD/NAD(P)-binding protein [Anaerolineales bacterium]